jgi:arylsulfatase A-like enzyme
MLRGRAPALLIACTSALSPGCGETAPPGQGRGVLLIAIDGLRADHLSKWTEGRDTTSRLIDTLAKRGVSFSRAYSAAPQTIPAHAALLTGCDPYVSKRYRPQGVEPTAEILWRIPDPAPRLAREFLRHGYATAAFCDDPAISRLQGFALGFQTFVAREAGAEEQAGEPAAGVAAVGREFEQWLRQRSRGESWFAYLHLADLERTWRGIDPLRDTYFKPRPELSSVPPVGDAEHLFFAVPRNRWPGGLRTLGEYEAQYDGAIRQLDESLHRLLASLVRMGRRESTTVVVTGTYGMGFGEAGLILDHGTLADCDLHVPLVIWPSPFVPFEPGERDALASLLDVAPTLLDLEGLDVPPDMQGVSLARVVRDAREPSPRSWCFARAGFQEGIAVIGTEWRYERTLPWMASTPALSLSWYGGDPPDPPRAREVLAAQDAHGRPGPDIDPSSEPQVARTSRMASFDWIRRVEALRRQLQSREWLRGSVEDPAIDALLGR